MEIKNETVYVIYYDGKPYKTSGRKLVYTTIGSAKGVITTDSEEIARYDYEGSWWDLHRDERKKLANTIKERFEVVEYKPVNK